MKGPGALLSRFPKPAAQWGRLFAISALVGVGGGLAAAALEWGLQFGVPRLAGHITHLAGPDTFLFRWQVLILPAAGGLIAGLFVYFAAPDASGHGTDILTRAFHRHFGKMTVRGPAVGAVATVGVISCGGSAGPEGPVAALGAAIGSRLGDVFRLTPHQRRTMLVAGCAAGVGAIFRCPLGGALFAAALLYREPEFESDAIVPSFVASVVGYSTFMLFSETGERMLQGADALVFDSPLQLIPYAVLGPLCGLVTIFFSVCLRTVEHRLVPRSGLPRWLTPVAGGLITGGLACVLPQVMDGQYRFTQSIMDWPEAFQAVGAGWWWWAGLFAAVTLLKCMATAATVGSGAPGGVLGPSVFIGGTTGAFLGALIEAIYPGTFPESLRVALIPVGMGGVLAAGMRTPLAAIVMVMEMTGSFGLIVPLMLVCVSSYVVGRRWGLNDEQVRSSAESPAHIGDAVVHILESICVERLMDRKWDATAAPGETLGELVQRIQPGTRPVFAVIEDGRLVGLISLPDIHRIMDDSGLADAVIAADLMTERLAVIHPDDDLYHALETFRRENHDVLPVVNRRTDRWVGMLTRETVYETVRHDIEQTQKLMLREHTGLRAIGQEGQLQQLVMGVAPTKKDLVQRLLVPLQAVGKSLREADFRRNFKAQVIAVEEADGTIVCPPPLDAPLRTDQRLLAIVTPDEPRSSQPTRKADS